MLIYWLFYWTYKPTYHNLPLAEAPPPWLFWGTVGTASQSFTKRTAQHFPVPFEKRSDNSMGFDLIPRNFIGFYEVFQGFQWELHEICSGFHAI